MRTPKTGRLKPKEKELIVMLRYARESYLRNGRWQDFKFELDRLIEELIFEF